MNKLEAENTLRNVYDYLNAYKRVKGKHAAQWARMIEAVGAVAEVLREDLQNSSKPELKSVKTK